MVFLKKPVHNSDEIAIASKAWLRGQNPNFSEKPFNLWRQTSHVKAWKGSIATVTAIRGFIHN